MTGATVGENVSIAPTLEPAKKAGTERSAPSAPRVWPALLLAGLAVTWAMFALVRRLEDGAAQTEFTRVAEQRLLLLDANLRHAFDQLLAVAAFIDSTPSLSRSTFKRMASPILLRQPSVQALEWIPALAPEDVAPLERLTRSDFPDFTVHALGQSKPSQAQGPRPAYFPVLFVEPLQGNEAALGLDLGSDPARLAALESAGAKATGVATGRIQLVQETSAQYGFLLLEPVYAKADTFGPGASGQRGFMSAPGGLRGFVAGVFRIGDLVELRNPAPADSAPPMDMDIFVFDEQAPPGERLLYPMQSTVKTVDQLPFPSVSRSLQVGDRTWTVAVMQASAALSADRTSSLAVLVAGLLLTVLGAASTHMRSRHKMELDLRVQREAEYAEIEKELEARIERRTAQLKESNSTLETTVSNLRAAQSQLVQSEKMATLGQIVASVAHEINTPIGAVKSSGESISVALSEVLAGFPGLVMSLDELTRKIFFALIKEVRHPLRPMSTREERKLNRALSSELDEVEIDQAQAKADLLIALRVYDRPLRFAALLTHHRSMEILGMANQIATLINSTDNIKLAVERVAKIVFALKSFSHTDHTGEMHPADLREGLETVLTIYRSPIKQGVELTRLYGDVPSVLCWEDELNQVWMNLIYNALQAMQNSGKLTVKVAALDDGVAVSISDNGPGIPDEIKGRIFDPFFTTKRVGEGSGLGLDIARKIVKKHQGRIELWSEVGLGTMFTVWVPLQPIVDVQVQESA